MMTIVEQIAPASRVRAELAYFHTHSFSELVAAASADQKFLESVGQLDTDLRLLIRRCADGLSASETAAIIDEWDRWCERYEELEYPALEDLLLDVFIALPS
jgi:hypothetical protein